MGTVTRSYTIVTQHNSGTEDRLNLRFWMSHQTRREPARWASSSSQVNVVSVHTPIENQRVPTSRPLPHAIRRN